MYVCVLVTQSCLSLCDPMDYSLLGSSVHGHFQAKLLEWISHSLLQGVFLTQGSNLGLLHCRRILYYLSHQGSPRRLASYAAPQVHVHNYKGGAVISLTFPREMTL